MKASLSGPVSGHVKEKCIPTTETGFADVYIQLHKTLKDRHLSMIAMGGALGTGLLIGT